MEGTALVKTYGLLMESALAHHLSRGAGNLGEYLYYTADTHKVYADKAVKHTGSPLISFPIANYTNYFTTDRAVYVDVHPDKDELTYLPTSRIDAALKDGGDPWTSPLRQSAKPGRVIRMLLAPECPYDSDRSVEQVVNKIAAQYFVWRKMTLSVDYDVDTIERVYADTSHAASCRSGMSARNRGYDQSNLGIAYMSSDGVVFARALAWRCEDGAVFIDRQYGTEAAMKTLRAKAREAGYYHKPGDEYYGTPFAVSPDGIQEVRNFVVKLDDDRWWTESRYPYFDTMSFLSRTDPHVSMYMTDKTTHNTGFTTIDPRNSNYL